MKLRYLYLSMLCWWLPVHAMEGEVLEISLLVLPHLNEIIQELSEQGCECQQQEASSSNGAVQPENESDKEPWLSHEDKVVWSLSLGAAVVYLFWHYTH